MKKILILMLITLTGNRLYAQNKVVSGNITYTTEIQYNFKKKVNWVNLLALNGQFSTEAMGLWRGGFLDIEFISIYRTSNRRIADDWQVFSNIDEQNRPLGIFTLGYTQQFEKINLFFGIRNVNRDYFTTPYTSLFTNSSCGIYPTISANYPVANYPLSAMCLHGEYDINANWSVKSSLYNGTAYESLKKTFTINPKYDGIANMTQIGYTKTSKYYGTYNLGYFIHSGMPVCNENGKSQFNGKTVSQKKTKVDYSLWANAEQCIYTRNEREIGVLAQLSFALPDKEKCSQYYGAGLLFNGWTTRSKKDQSGIFINRAKFGHNVEVALELTWKYQIINNLEIQPALHLIENNGNLMTAGLLRLLYTLNLL